MGVSIHPFSCLRYEGCVYMYITSFLLPSLGTAIEKECRVIRDFYWRVPVKKMFDRKVQNTLHALVVCSLSQTSCDLHTPMTLCGANFLSRYLKNKISRPLVSSLLFLTCCLFVSVSSFSLSLSLSLPHPRRLSPFPFSLSLPLPPLFPILDVSRSCPLAILNRVSLLIRLLST